MSGPGGSSPTFDPSSPTFDPSSPTLDPWLEGLIANGDMIKANVSSGLDRGDVLFVEMDDNGKLKTTWKEIMLSMIAGKLVVVREMNFAGTTATVRFDVLTAVGFTEEDGFVIYGQGIYYADGVDDAPVFAGQHESGGGGALVVNMAWDEEKGNEYTNKTWKEISDAPMAVIVQNVVISGDNTAKTIGLVVQVENKGSAYSVSYYDYSLLSGEVTVQKLVTDSENGYLTWSE